jgi:hypothetical protein
MLVKRRALWLGFLLASGAAWAEPIPGLVWAAPVLSADLTDAPLPSVVQQISTDAGVKFVGELDPNGRVTAHFERLPLEEALPRILKKSSFIFLHFKGQAVMSRVILLPRTDPLPQPTPTPTPSN